MKESTAFLIRAFRKSDPPHPRTAKDDTERMILAYVRSEVLDVVKQGIASVGSRRDYAKKFAVCAKKYVK